MDPLIEDNVLCLEQGIQLLEGLPSSLYGRRCEACFNSSVGAHVRHNTDHYEQFLAGVTNRRIDYDARSRSTEVETVPARAVELMRSLCEGLRSLPATVLEASVEVRMDGGGAAAWTPSSVRRELQFLISHTIHHYALIATIAPAIGHEALPADFGVAPSTLKHRAGQAS